MKSDNVPVSGVDKDAVVQLFPLISEIKDTDIRAKVIEVWIRIWKESGLGSIERSPADRDNIFTLVRHTNVTAQLSLDMARELIKQYRISINVDNLLAIAILHDADQIILREKKGATVRPSTLEKQIPHGIYGGHIALEVGLSSEIAHGIIFHRPAMEPHTVEAVIVKYCDNANYLAYAISRGWLTDKE